MVSGHLPCWLWEGLKAQISELQLPHIGGMLWQGAQPLGAVCCSPATLCMSRAGGWSKMLLCFNIDARVEIIYRRQGGENSVYKINDRLGCLGWVQWEGAGARGGKQNRQPAVWHFLAARLGLWRQDLLVKHRAVSKIQQDWDLESQHCSFLSNEQSTRWGNQWLYWQFKSDYWKLEPL